MARPVTITLRPLTAAILLALTGPSNAASIPVNGTTCTLANAIKAANTNKATGGCIAGSGADTLNLTAATYTLRTVDPDTSRGSNGLPLITSVVTVNGDPDGDGRGAVIQRSSATGTPDFRLLAVSNGNLTLKYVTLRNGAAKIENDGYYDQRQNGGGIALYGSRLTLDHSTVTKNKGGALGGGIFATWRDAASQITAIDSTVSDNMARVYYKHGSGVGGGIFGGASSVVLKRSVVSGNLGGAISSDNVTVTDSIIKDNEGWYGTPGGISSGSSSRLGQLRLYRSTVSGNHSDYGAGGIRVSGPVLIENSTVSGNRCHYYNTAGGVVGSGTIVNSTITGNLGAGLSASPAGITLTNSVIANNGDPGGYTEDCEGAVTLAGVNLIGDGSCGGLAGDPKLGPLLNNGGLVPTHALLTGSPAINMADGATCLSDDQRGAMRPQGSACDIGAFEQVTAVNASVRAVVTFFDGAVAAGTLSGTGAAAERTFRVQGIRHALLLAGEFKRRGFTPKSCDQLRRTLDRIDTDGATPDGSDYVTGPASPQLVEEIRTVRTSLGCS